MLKAVEWLNEAFKSKSEKIEFHLYEEAVDLSSHHRGLCLQIGMDNCYMMDALLIKNRHKDVRGRIVLVDSFVGKTKTELSDIRGMYMTAEDYGYDLSLHVENAVGFMERYADGVPWYSRAADGVIRPTLRNDYNLVVLFHLDETLIDFLSERMVSGGVLLVEDGNKHVELHKEYLLSTGFTIHKTGKTKTVYVFNK